MSIQDNEAPKTDLGKNRKTIRKKIVEILKAANLSVGQRVFPNATIPPWEEELPVILVYPRSEPADEFAIAPRELKRDLDLAIEIIAAGPELNPDTLTPKSGQKSLEDQLDDIAEEIECAMDMDETLGGTCDNSILTLTEFEYEPGGGQPIGSARMTYAVSYNTMAPRDIDKQGGLVDFKTTNAKWTDNDDQNTIEGEDTIAIPQV